jgi:hypothetical protein
MIASGNCGKKKSRSPFRQNREHWMVYIITLYRNFHNFISFKVPQTEVLTIAVLWDANLCRVLNVDRLIKKTSHPYLQGRRKSKHKISR